MEHRIDVPRDLDQGQQSEVKGQERDQTPERGTTTLQDRESHIPEKGEGQGLVIEEEDQTREKKI